MERGVKKPLRKNTFSRRCHIQPLGVSDRFQTRGVGGNMVCIWQTTPILEVEDYMDIRMGMGLSRDGTNMVVAKTEGSDEKICVLAGV